MHPSKQPRTSPTGLTPTQRFKRHVQHSDSASRRRLFEQPSASKSDSTEAVAGTRSTVSIRAIEVVKNPARSRLYPPSLSSVWSPTEDETLTQFMLLSTTGDIWSSTKSTKFWEGAATFLKNKAGTKRTSKLPCEVYLCLVTPKSNLKCLPYSSKQGPEREVSIAVGC